MAERLEGVHEEERWGRTWGSYNEMKWDGSMLFLSVASVYHSFT
jgi:hypothetical protein